MGDIMLIRDVPEHIRSVDGAEMTAKVVRNWLTQVGAKTLYIEPGSSWENGYCEPFNGKLRDELLNGDTSNLLSENVDDVKLLMKMLPGSDVAKALKDLAIVEKQYAKAAKALKAAKKHVAIVMDDGPAAPELEKVVGLEK